MDLHKAEEFRSNLLLLLQCGHPEGLPIGQLKSEYKQYFSEDIGPESILPRGFKNNKHWDALFSLKEFKDDFTLFYMGPAVYVKATRKRNHSEMKLIAQLAKHSHLEMARKADFQCNCCTPDFWRNLAKEAANEPMSNSSAGNHHHHHHHHQGHPEDIVVKIEPHMMNNGDDDSTTGDGLNRIHEGLYPLDHQMNHGNHQPHHQHISGFNGGSADPSGSASNMSSSTNDGFMLDHQLRVQQHSSPQGQSLQAFASLLNNSANSGQVTNPDGSTVGQPFFTFLLQNGELKVMQVVSSVPETQSSNGEVHTSPQAPSITVSTPSSSHSVSNIPQQLNLSDLINIGYSCSTPGCKENFDDKQILQNHERTCIHKKYPCTFPGCDRRFKNSKQRHAHMTSRHRGSENTFKCTVPECAAFFKTVDRLKVHESRCRFKYEQFQLMDVEASINNNNRYLSSIANNPTLSTVETHHSGPNTAFTSTLQQAASIMPELHSVVVPGLSVPAGVRLKIENPQSINIPVQEGIQGFSTVDLSLVKSEVME